MIPLQHIGISYGWVVTRIVKWHGRYVVLEGVARSHVFSAEHSVFEGSESGFSSHSVCPPNSRLVTGYLASPFRVLGW